MFKKIIFLASVLLVITSILTGCGSTSSDSSTTVPTTRSYIGALAKGDLVSYTLSSDNTFNLVNSTLGITISGKYRPYTIPTLNITCKEAYDIVYNGVLQSGVTVPFVELEGIALISYVPDGIGGREMTVFTIDDTPSLDGSLDGDYYFINVVSQNVAEASTSLGTYVLTTSNVTANIFSYDDTNLTTTDNVITSNMSVVTGYLNMPVTGIPTINVSVTPEGVMIIDHGPNQGISVGTKKPASNYLNSELVGNQYLVMSTLGSVVVKVDMMDGYFDMVIWDFINDTTSLYPSVNYTQDKPGLFSASYNSGTETVRYALLNEKVFFGVHSDTTDCDDNFVGVKVN